MNVAPVGNRLSGLSRLEDFACSAGTRYAKTRNFDFGPERRENVSRLSPYVRHRLVLEQELIEAALARHSLTAAGKFVQEVFWRAYFKGWLEHRPSVWRDYRHDIVAELARLETDARLRDHYDAATTGATGIDCFDAWATELVRTGYLHNHARMWFASIWVFTLGLPWQLGADFFLRHLIDGDPASNTLSWRWVCGLHTQGKTYLARVSNITSYTDDRFNPQGQLAVSAPPLSESRVHPLREIPAAARLPECGRVGLLITEEDCFAESLFSDLRPRALLGLVATGTRSPLPVGIPAADFARAAVDDALDRAGDHFGVTSSRLETEDWAAALADWAAGQRVDTIVTAYAPVGPVAGLLAEAASELRPYGLRLVQVRRPFDERTWPHATSGYFKLREKIPVILDALQIAAHDCKPRREAM